MTNYEIAYKALKSLILDENNVMEMRINALKAIDILSFGYPSSLGYDENHVKWFVNNGDLELINVLEDEK